MKKTMALTINQPLMNTYRWLNVNATKLYVPTLCAELRCCEEIPECIESRKEARAASDFKTGMGEDMDRFLSEAPDHVYSVPAGAKTADVLRLAFSHTGRSEARSVSLNLADNSELTVVMDISSAASAGLAAIQTKVRLGSNAVLRLVQMQRLSERTTLLNDVGVLCGENAQFELYRLVLSGQNTYDGCAVELSGDRSRFEANIGYRLAREERLDMNYEAIHTGKRSECDIHASGVLRDHAFKLFRGTIDLRKDCSGSEGNEVEDVLLMDETVRNQSIPVILCGEEDVVGNHGATIGRLDEELVYYLSSRGMTREKVYDLMARARLDAVIAKLPDEKTKKELQKTEETA